MNKLFSLKNVRLFISIFVITNIQAQNNPSSLFQNWVTSQQNNTEPILPTFSYSGYHNGEISIPNPPHTVFNVTDYGAIPNDNISDKAAFMAAIAAAENNGSGIVFFPPGTFLINEPTDNIDELIFIKKSNIVIKGSGSGVGGTELVQNSYTNPTNASSLWSSPYLIKFTPTNTSKPTLTTVTGNSTRESFSVTVADPNVISVGDWVRLRLSDNNATLVSEEFSPYPVDNSYTTITNEVKVLEIHKVISKSGNTITFKEPIHRTINASYNWFIEKFPVIEEVGVQDLSYKGGFTTNFVHHGTFQDDSGWSGIEFNQVANGWIYNVKFSQMSRCAQFKISTNCSALKNKYVGNPGHAFISTNAATGCIIGYNNDNSTGVWHNCGVGSESIGNVLWRNEMPTNGNSGIEIHANQPRANLIDVCKGGLGFNQGGAVKNQPNHLRHLVIWNFEGKGYTNTGFEFWKTNQTYGKIIPPIVSGLVGFTLSNNASQTQENESPGAHVDEESLYEEQLKYRLGTLPSWINALPNSNVTGISISTTSIEINEQQSFSLSATVTPSDASNKNITWSSAASNIATVNSNGLVTGISKGVTQITATSTDGNFTASATVTVRETGASIQYVETLNKMNYIDDWVTDSYIGDNGFTWNIEAKSVRGYIDNTNEIYMRSGKIGAFSGTIPGGIGSFSVSCKDLFEAGKERTLQLIINNNVVNTFTHTGTEQYTYNVDNINIEGPITIGIKNNSTPTDTNLSIAIENITWTNYNSKTTLNTNGLLLENAINIYPNPASNILNISNPKKINIKSIELINLMGDVIFNKKTDAINVSNIDSGIYFLKITSNQEDILIKKIIID